MTFRAQNSRAIRAGVAFAVVLMVLFSILLSLFTSSANNADVLARRYTATMFYMLRMSREYSDLIVSLDEFSHNEVNADFIEIKYEVLLGRYQVMHFDSKVKYLWSYPATQEVLHDLESSLLELENTMFSLAEHPEEAQRIKSQINNDYDRLYALFNENFTIRNALIEEMNQQRWRQEFLIYCLTVITAIMMMFFFFFNYRQVKNIEKVANTDFLTGLPNRLGLQHCADALFTKNRAFTLFLLDLDGFKYINDTYGHDTGDQLLIQFSKSLRKLSGEKRVVARMGGDEFIFLVEGADEEENLRIAQSILQSVEPNIVVGSRTFHLTVSVGSSRYFSGQSFEHAMAQADSAMYMAKRNGKNAYHPFDEHCLSPLSSLQNAS